MKIRKQLLLTIGTVLAMTAPSAQAIDRLFTYTYEPETMPKDALEFEQWITLRAGRPKETGRENYSRWELREELEYGVTDNYTLHFYLNTRSDAYREVATGADVSSFRFTGISIANQFMLVNPAENPVGLSLYLEPTYSGDEAAFEQKILLGQRHGDWKWALNLIHETEWEDNFHKIVGEFEATFGLSYQLTKNLWLGGEARNVNEMPEYKEWESSAVYVGPAIHYRRENWWATLTVLPQVWGKDYDGNTDGTSGFDLAHNERINVRLIFGIHF